MNAIFSVLPGEPLPVSQVESRLQTMWQPEESFVAAGVNLAETRASQLSLVLHFGRATTEEEAQEIFDSAIVFAQRSPCRIIVLCAGEEHASDELAFQAKLYANCFLGDSLRKHCCCEALILAYPRNAPLFLENQLTLWLEADLPVYHWFHRVPSDRVNQHYLGFLKKCNRVVYDSDIEDEGYRSLPWPKEGLAHDLASARLLAVRQSIGQFLSAYDESTLMETLHAVQFRHVDSMAGEAYQLATWMDSCFTEMSAAWSKEMMSLGGACQDDCCLQVVFQYSDEKSFAWSYHSGQGTGVIQGDLGRGEFVYPLHLKKPALSATLSEALFFNVT